MITGRLVERIGSSEFTTTRQANEVGRAIGWPQPTGSPGDQLTEPGR